MNRNGRNDFTNAGGTSSRHNQNTENDNMEANTNTNDAAARILVWTKPDGPAETGTYAELGQRYYTEGYGKDGHSLRPLMAAAPEPDEDEDDAPTVEGPTLSVVTATPTATVAPSPVTAAVVAETIARREGAADRKDWTTDVHEDDRKAAEADAQMLKDMGLTPGRTLFAPGTPLVRWGLDTWKAERVKLDAMPGLHESAEAIRAEVAAEDRIDTVVRFPSELTLEATTDGLIMSRGGGSLRIERHGLQRLAAAMPGMLPGAAFRSTMSADEIAHLWNSRAARGCGRPPKGGLVLRHRRAADGEGRSLYAAVSTSYGAHDADDLVMDLAHILPGDMAGSIVYDADRVATSWEVLTTRDVPPVVGEVWKAGLKGGSRDDGTGSAWNSGAFWRAICCNLTTEVLETARSRQRHRGDHVATAFRAQLQAAMTALRPALDQFRDRWAVLADTPAVNVLGGVDVAEAIARMVDQQKGLRDAAGVKRDALVAMLLQSHSVEGGESLADVVNAVTRLHESKLPVRRVAAVEAQAGLLARTFADAARS
jgi:hypothetical protein